MHKFSSVARYIALILVLIFSAGVDGASLKVCKRTCGPSIQIECLGLRKGKLKKCRKRIWKACKRGQTDCVVVTSTTMAAIATTSSTTVPTTTTTTLPPAEIVYAGRWVVHPTIVSDTCDTETGDNVLDIRGTAAEATATLELPGLVLSGAVDESGNLLLSVDSNEPPGCITELAFRLLGPLQTSDLTTTGDASLTRRCGDVVQCQTLFTCSFDRTPPS